VIRTIDLSSCCYNRFLTLGIKGPEGKRIIIIIIIIIKVVVIAAKNLTHIKTLNNNKTCSC